MSFAICRENRPNPSYPPKLLRHRHFLQGGFRAIRLSPPTDLSGPPANSPDITLCKHTIWSGWAGRAGFSAKSPEFLK
jgi:hypothetical protein